MLVAFVLSQSVHLSAADEDGFHTYKETDRQFLRFHEFTEVHKSPDFSSKVIDTIRPKRAGLVLKSNVKLYPGKVIVKNPKLAKKYGVDMQEQIPYFGSVGEILQPELQLKGREPILVEESFDAGACAENRNAKDLDNCWLKVIEEPVIKGWSFIRYGKDQKTGWVYKEVLANDISQEPGVE